MRVLLDTCVLSEIRKSKGATSVKEAVNYIPDENLYISVISLGEIIKGIELLKQCKQKTVLKKWMLNLETDYGNSILPIDKETAEIWGRMTASLQKNGKILSVCDGLIAATAKRHGLYIMTRNVSDFEDTGIAIINPWT